MYIYSSGKHVVSGTWDIHLSHTFHGTGIYAYIAPPKLPQLIGIYSSPMECMGIASISPLPLFGPRSEPRPVPPSEGDQ